MKAAKSCSTDTAIPRPVVSISRASHAQQQRRWHARSQVGCTNVYTEKAQGHAVYDWTVADRIFDTYLAREYE